jgi:hypothetical protein
MNEGKNEKLEQKDIAVEKGKFLKWLDNYWYHYKWPTIVVVFFIIVFAVCFIQSITHEEKDILITYGGPTSLTGDEKLAIETVLTDALPEGFGNNGTEGKAGFIPYIIYSKEQIKDAENKQLYVDTVFNGSEYSTLNSQYKTGNGSIYLLDRWLYDELLDEDGTTDRLKPLAEVFGSTPDGAIDDYAVRLGDTALYKNSPALRVLPADTIICLHEKIVGQKDYEKEVDAFKLIAQMAPATEKPEN